MALERLKSCESVKALSKELGIHRALLYEWRQQMESAAAGQDRSETSRERELREEIRQLQRLVGIKAREVDFFKGALQKVAARRRSNGGSGEKASTTKSGS